MNDSENPYAAPEALRSEPTGFDPRNLTPLERTVLVAYRRWHERPPTRWTMFRRSWKNWLTVIVLNALLIVALRFLDLYPMPLFVMGVVAGMMLRDYALWKFTILVWPMLDQHLDWPRIEQTCRAAGLDEPSRPDVAVN